MTPPDDVIIKGFLDFDAQLTKKYFYGFCQRAYNIYDYKYQLSKKEGLDFYSLAHEYYIHLLKHEFQPLLNKPKDTKLSTWMTHGFYFVVQDALKAYNKHADEQNEEIYSTLLSYMRDSEDGEGMLPQVVKAVERHYCDPIMTQIANLVIYQGFKQNEVAQQLGISPAAVNQRYKRMMDEVVTPFVTENYSHGIWEGEFAQVEACADMLDLCDMSMPCEPSFRLATPDTHVSECKERCTLGYGSKHRFMLKKSSFYSTPRIMENRITKQFIKTLQPDEIFVFGSNLQGMHAGGAARAAHCYFGAEWGNGVGIQGQSYAIPTMQGGPETIQPYVDEFIEYAKSHPEQKFLVTPIGCGIAGFTPQDIAPLFKGAVDVKNIALPQDFWDILNP